MDEKLERYLYIYVTHLNEITKVYNGMVTSFGISRPSHVSPRCVLGRPGLCAAFLQYLHCVLFCKMLENEIIRIIKHFNVKINKQAYEKSPLRRS